MARNSSGTYQIPAGDAAVAGQIIDPDKFNNQITDIGNEITNSVDRLGRSPMQANLPMGAHEITGLSDPTTDQSAVTKHYLANYAVPFTQFPQIADKTILSNISGSPETPLANTLADVVGAMVIPSVGSAMGLVVSNTATASPSSQVAITASKAVLFNSSGGGAVLTSVNQTVSVSTSGAGGLDTGSVAASTWYHVYLIYSSLPTPPITGAVSSLVSLNATAPTLPTGYTYFLRVGAVKTDGSSALYRTMQRGNVTELVVTVGTNTPDVFIAANGPAGNVSISNGLVAVAVSGSLIPSTATRVRGSLLALGTNVSIVAPNNGYTLNRWPTYLSGVAIIMLYDILLQSTNIYWAGNGSNTTLSVSGWVDSINAS